MKYLYIGILILISNLTTVAQSNSNSAFFPFIKYVSSNYNLSEVVRQDCHWHYAIVKVSTNNADIITRYEIINIDTFGDAMADGFKFLIGYRFPAKLNIRQRPVVFCLTVNNEKFDCIPEQATQNPPSEVLGRLLAAFNVQQKKQPNTIFLYALSGSGVLDSSK